MSCNTLHSHTPILTPPGRSAQQVRELGLPKILDVIYVGCPASGKAEGVLELRMALYDIAFSLTLPRCKCSLLVRLTSVPTLSLVFLAYLTTPPPPPPLSPVFFVFSPPPPPCPLSCFFLPIYFFSFSSLSPSSFPSSAAHGAASRTKLLEQPIPASFLKLEERVRELARDCQAEDKPPMLREGLFR